MIDFEPIIRAYVVAALWSTTDESTPEGGEPMDANYGPDDLSESARRAVARDVRDFVVGCLKGKPNAFHGMDASQIGHDFLLTRNGHGAGFWDRGLGARGEWLTQQCKPYGEASFYVGDDGKIYVSGDETYTGAYDDGTPMEACGDCSAWIRPDGTADHLNDCLTITATL